MGWTAPSTWNPGQVVGASDLNVQLRDNMAYLLSQRPGVLVKRDNNAAYTTTSAVFVDVDSTNLAISLTINGSAVLVTFAAVVTCSLLGDVYMDITVDGTRYGSAGADGVWETHIDTAGYGHSLSGAIMVTGLSAGLHTFKLQWKTNTGTASLFSGLAPTDVITCFGAREIG